VQWPHGAERTKINIFYLDKDPVLAAQYQVDRHVVKMVVETAQLLSTAHRLLDGQEIIVELKHKDTGKIKKKRVWILPDNRNDILYACTHRNHPSAVWCRSSVENYNWLVDHLHALGQEYTYRYGKTHATIKKCFYELQSPPYGLRAWDWSEPPSAMAKHYIVSNDSVLNYRNYYRYGKANLHRWKNREPPAWIL
jgi:hypothetical protein